MILVLIFFSSYVDSLLMERVFSDFQRDSSYLSDSFNYRFYYVKDNLYRIEVEKVVGRDRLNDIFYVSLKEELVKGLEEETEQRGRGLIPDIDIPIPVEFPFGLGKGARIKIDGFQSLSLSLTRRTHEREVKTVEQGSSAPEIKLNQHLKVNTEGVIGEKIHILIDHDSERESQDLNTIKIRYEGDEDEIIKSIEGGNVLYSAGGGGKGGKGYFGLKGEFQLGGLNLLTVFSREQGEAKELELSRGGVQVDTIKIYDHEYVRDKFFILFSPDGTPVDPNSIFVFYLPDKDTSNDRVSERSLVWAKYFYDISGDSLSIPYRFEILERGRDWDLAFLSNVISLNISLDSDDKIGVYYKTQGGTKVGDYNPTVPQDTAKLLIIRDEDMQNSTHPSWKYMLRNVYYIGEIKFDSSAIQIYKESPGIETPIENNKTYLNILGLDLDGDGVIERVISNDTLINFTPYQNNYLMFPLREPFAFHELEEPDSIIYKTININDLEQREVRYYIKVVTKKRPQVINLGFRIIEGSEEIYFGDVLWKRGEDYTIDYETGTIIIRNQDYLKDFSRNLRIKYKQASVFQTKKRTYVTFKADYDFGEGSKWDMGVVYRGETPFERKPALGEEPKSVYLFNSNLKIQKELSFLKTGFEKIPWISMEKSPVFKFNISYNQSFPNPNTMGGAYLDDMEGTDIEEILPISHARWRFGSLPSFLKDSQFVSYVRTPDDLADKIIWVETNREIRKGDVYRNLPEEEKDDYESVMKVIIRPGVKGKKAWASLNTLILKEGIDLSNSDYIEIIIKADAGTLGIDLGTEINEDVYWRDKNGNLKGTPGVEDTEDGKNGGTPVGTFESVEDVGLDGIPDGSPGDDGNDNYDPENIEYVNGTEGNGRLDSEDLEGDGLDTRDDVFSYVIDLTDPKYQYQPVYNGFKFFRIPLRDSNFYKKYGSPDFTLIKKVRIFFTGFSKTDTLYIVKISIKGNRYFSKGVFKNGERVSDSLKRFFITSYSNKKDGAIYQTPEEFIEIQRDLYGNVEEEKTLVLRYENLEKGEYGLAVRVLPVNQNFWEYKKLRFLLQARPDTGGLPTFFIRFSSPGDTGSYYEYRVNHVGTDWRMYEIDLQKFTDLKKKRIPKYRDSMYADPQDPRYIVKGEPNFLKIKYYTVGILNENNDVIKGEVLFNEMFLSNPDRKGAYSVTGNIALDGGSLFRLNIGFSKKSAGFSDLSLKRRTSSSESFNSSLSLGVDEWLNIGFLSLPLTLSMSKDRELPIFRSGSDIRLSREEALREITRRENYGVNFSVARKKKAVVEEGGSLIDKLLKFTFDPWRYRYSYNFVRNKTPYNFTRTENNQQSIDYNLPIPFQGWKFLGQNINPFPGNIGLNISYSNTFLKALQFNDIDSTWIQTSLSRRRGARLSYSLQNIRPLNSISFGFGASKEYDLNLRKVTGKFYGMDIREDVRFSFSYRPVLPSFLRTFIIAPSFSFNSNFSDNHDVQGQKDTLNPLRNVQNNANYTIQGTFLPFEIIKFIVKLGNPEALKDVSKLRSLIQNINFSYSRNISSSYFNLRRSPSIYYKLGRTFNPQIDYVEDINNRRNDTRNYRAGTSFKISDFTLNLSGNYSENISYTAAGFKTENKQRSFPEINFNISGLNKRFKFLDKYFSSLGLNTSYRLQKTENISGEVKNIGKNISQSPLLSLQGRMRNGWGFNFSYNRSVSESKTLGVSESESKNINTGLQGSFDFSLSKSLSEKLFGFMKVRTEVSANISFSYQNTKRIVNGILYSENIVQRIDGTLNYIFTQDITGSSKLSYMKTADKISGISNSAFEFSFGVKISF